MVCLDTNTLIHFFKGMGGVGERLLATPPAQVAVPTVVVYEIQVGILKSGSPERRRTDFDAFLAPLQVLPFGQAEAAEAAAIRAHLENAGAPIGPMDTLIAATARANGATLISRNLREFSRVPDLRLESWYRE